MFKFYEVGGKVRDELLGLQSKDVDYVAVPDEETLAIYKDDAKYMFLYLEQVLRKDKFEIFLITKDCYTIRARFPEGHHYQGVADFVMARKEIGYIEGTRTPIIVPGTLYDDLERRDFTVNAMARDEDGSIIDPFNGQKDLKDRILKTPLPCEITFNDDPLRILRAIRFSITKDLIIPFEMRKVISMYDYKTKMIVVSEERIREELYKCFKFDTCKTLSYLMRYVELKNYIFKHTNLWLKPTNEK